MKIPVPQRGQPIDIDYIYQIVSQLNSLTTQISSNSTVLSTVDNGIARKDSTTNNLRFFASTKSVKKTQVTANSTEPWFIDFSPNFLYIPIVIATPVNNNSSSTAGDNVITVINKITTSRVDGKMIFNTAGNVDVNVNIIAIGTT